MTAAEKLPEERHAVSNLELFLDLVFVFAVAQITSYVAAHLNWEGALRSVILAWFGWWQWTAFTWLGTAVDFVNQARHRVLVLGLIPAVLVMAITAPQAFDHQGVWFASAYLAVQLMVVLIQGVELWGISESRGAFLRYIPFAASAPLVILLGAFMDGSARVAVWAIAAGMFVISAILGGKRGGDWSISADHFSERHGLFIIIALGEVLVAIGVNAANASATTGLDGSSLGAIVATAVVASALWWTYFAITPKAFEIALARVEPNARGPVARDIGSFLHFPIVGGIIAYAVVAKHVIQHPAAHLHTPDQILLALSGALFIGGIMGIQWNVRRVIAWERVIGILLIAVLAVSAGNIPGSAVIAIEAVVLTVMAAITWRRFQRTGGLSALERQ